MKLPRQSPFLKSTFKLLKNNLVFILIFIFALTLRSYNLQTLTTFARDQGIDFLSVKKIIDTKDIPLTGIQVSFANFHQGPVYLYILVPFFIIFKLNPIAGAVAAIFLSMLTLCILYFFIYKFVDQKSAIIASTIFAVSPQFIKFGNTPLYQHFVPLPIFLALYFFLVSIKYQLKQKHLLYLLTSGFFAGIAMEMHFLSLTFSISLIIFLLIQNKSRVKRIATFLTGLVLALTPTILFELKNRFVNARAFIAYLQSSSVGKPPIEDKVFVWVQGAANFFGGENRILGIFILAFCLVLIFSKHLTKNKTLISIRKLTLIELSVCLVYSLFARNLGWWYMLPLWIMFLISISIYLGKSLNNKKVLLVTATIIIVNSFRSISQLQLDHGYYMPKGLSLKSLTQVSQIIKNDANGWRANFNLVDIASGDSRAYALRYILHTQNKIPGGITEYNQTNALYIIYTAPRENIQNILQEPVWEISQFSPYELGVNWELNENIFIQRLDRKVNIR